MCKKIKKQIARSLPLFLILGLLLSSSVAGLILNLNIERVGTKIKISLSSQNAAAQNDFASTTVEVRNAPPKITTGQEPYEVPTSTSTSPINVGAGISFKTTATDAESNDYFLIVCTSAGVTAVNANPPTCDGGLGDTLCVSASTTAGLESTCTDAAMANYAAESLPWYAYVCDGHASQADCSPVSHGNGTDEDASPLFVNHSPILDAVSTTDDFKVPGGTFTYTATSTDTDIAGDQGADDVILHICRTNSYSTTTGCAVGEELCSATSTAVATEAVVSCTWQDTIPTVDQAYTYYAFIRDWHDLAATVGDGQGTSDTYTIINVAPVVSGVTINGGNPITVGLRYAPETSVEITATLSDDNTANDISSASGTIYWSDAVDGYNCTDNDNNCYQMDNSLCMITNRVGATADLTCSTTLKYFAIPSVAGLTDYTKDATEWLGGVSAFDEALSNSLASVGGVELNQTIGLTVSEPYIPYETIKGGENTGAYNATTTLINYGNVPLDSDISGTDMDHESLPANIPVNNQKFGIIKADYAGLASNLALASAEVEVVIDRPTSDTDFEDEIYWGIAIPNGTVSGNYEGTNTFSAVVDQNGGNWND